MSDSITFTALSGLPDVRPADDLAELILAAIKESGLRLQTGDVLAIAQKVVSKAEDRFVQLDSVQPGTRAQEVAHQTQKDPRLVELILRESQEISRMRPGVLIVRHRLGFVSANAGIDRSNVRQSGHSETVLLLPEDPDRSAADIRSAIHQRIGADVAVIVTDSHGRPFRLGTVGIAIGVAGMPALWDRRGEADLYGYTLQHTDVGLADEIAAAAGLLMGQAAEACPVVLIRGLDVSGSGKAADLIRSRKLDLYR